MLLLLLAGLCAPAQQIRDLANEAREAGRVDEAIGLYRKAVAQQPEWAEGWWYLGTLYFSTSRLQEALDSFQQITARNPKAGPAYAFMGMCEFQLRDYDAALADLQRARAYGIGQDQRMIAVARYELAILLNRYGSHDEAHHILSEIAREGQDSPALVNALGLAVLLMPYLPSETPPEKLDLVREAGEAALLAARMRPKEAIEHYERLAVRHPDAAGVHYAMGEFLLNQEPNRAMAEFRRELEVNPANSYARLQIALYLLQEGAFRDAEVYARRAAEAEPRWFMTRQAYGRVLLELGRAEPAIHELEASAKLEPENAQTHFHLSRAYQLAGREANASRERAEFRRLDRQERAATAAPPPSDNPEKH